MLSLNITITFCTSSACSLHIPLDPFTALKALSLGAEEQKGHVLPLGLRRACEAFVEPRVAGLQRGDRDPFGGQGGEPLLVGLAPLRQAAECAQEPLGAWKTMEKMQENGRFGAPAPRFALKIKGLRASERA